MRISQRLLIIFSFLIIILFLDQLTKSIVSRTLPLNIPIPVLSTFLQLTYIRNPNAAFGISFGNRLPLLPLAILAILILLIIFIRSKHETRIEHTAVGLILGGALGNLVDRIRFGEVVDFIDVGIKSYRWPVFNVADSAVTVGIFLLILGAAIHKGEKKSAPSQEADADHR